MEQIKSVDLLNPTENASFSIFFRATSSSDCSSDTAGSNGGWQFNIFVSYVLSSRIGYLLCKQYPWGKRAQATIRNKLKVSMKHCNPFYLQYFMLEVQGKTKKSKKGPFLSFLKLHWHPSITSWYFPLLFQIYRYLLFLL